MNENKSYIKGILGGVIGGIIATIPWILMYVYGEMILSLLAILIAMGVLKGYQLFKGKVDNTDFLVYINVENGREEDILVIVNTPDGTLTH